jgi:hypothetical protein
MRKTTSFYTRAAILLTGAPNAMITSLHILLTYMCTMSCEHCFVCYRDVNRSIRSPGCITGMQNMELPLQNNR